MNSFINGQNGFTGLLGANQIEMTNYGRFLYVSCSGSDGINAFYRDTADGSLMFIEEINDNLAGTGSMRMAGQMAINDNNTGTLYLAGRNAVSWLNMDKESKIDLCQQSADRSVSINQHPNPFNPSTIISYRLAEKAQVILRIFNLQGRLIKTLENGQKQPGNHKVFWKAVGMPSGLYYFVLKTGDKTAIKKGILIK